MASQKRRRDEIYHSNHTDSDPQNEPAFKQRKNIHSKKERISIQNSSISPDNARLEASDPATNIEPCSPESHTWKCTICTFDNTIIKQATPQQCTMCEQLQENGQQHSDIDAAFNPQQDNVDNSKTNTELTEGSYAIINNKSNHNQSNTHKKRNKPCKMKQLAQNVLDNVDEGRSRPSDAATNEYSSDASHSIMRMSIMVEDICIIIRIITWDLIITTTTEDIDDNITDHIDDTDHINDIDDDLNMMKVMMDKEVTICIIQGMSLFVKTVKDNGQGQWKSMQIMRGKDHSISNSNS
eukprot:864731_1